MAKLYPPVIESTVSACYDENGMVKFTIPFSMNRAVSATQVGGFELKIKTVQTGSLLYTIKTINPSNYQMSETESYVIFYLKDEEKKLKVGQFYKVQLAYISISEKSKKEYYNKYINGAITLEEFENYVTLFGVTGHYSSTAAIKYTTKPKVYINDFEENILNSYTHNYTGYYSQENGDTSEKVYSYQFNIYDSSGQNILLSSGECLHNSSTDTNIDMSSDNYSVTTDLQYYTIYYIEYVITTINKMVISSPKYRIVQRETIDPELYADIALTQNFNNGYIDVSLSPHVDYFAQRAYNIVFETKDTSWLDAPITIMAKGFNEEQAEILCNNRNRLSEILSAKTTIPCSGSYVLSRASEDSNYGNWEELCRFKLFVQVPEGLIYRDFMVQQGKKYRYSIQQYNDFNLFSKRRYSDIITADFEDAFLFDGERQLKIRYNPKISKFANTILESKQDTIGGQYPFIFRNGRVSYHEFPIAGLISYLSDEEFLFMSQEELNIPTQPHRNETIRQNNKILDSRDNLGEDITRERLFKTKVLSWLNNGKPKLFRSPTEGNFLVRLMKISFSPEDKLGRMLHTFSCTAYEIAEYNNQNLRNLGIIKPEVEESNYIKFFTVDLSTKAPGAVLNLLNNEYISVQSLRCEDMTFGDELLITYTDGSQESIKIGITGNYYIDQLQPVRGISVMPRYRQVYIDVSDYDKNIHYIKNEAGEIEKGPESFSTKETYYEISNKVLKGLMTFSYFETNKNNFISIKNVTYPSPIFRQFIGENQDILDSIKKFNGVKDTKSQLIDWYYIKAERRPVDKIIQQSEAQDTIYYYGQDIYSDKLQFSEIRYPIGMRTYEPNVYYKKVNGVYELAEDNFQYEIYTDGEVTGYVTYYLRGHYELPENPIGRAVYKPGQFYVLDNGEYKLSEDEYVASRVYYTIRYDSYGVAHYDIKENLTASKDFIYSPGKFYRKTENNKYTLSNSYVEDQQLNERGTAWERVNYYYVLVPWTDAEIQEKIDAGKEDELYVNAYVTINDKYLYQSGEYFAQVTAYNQDDEYKDPENREEIKTYVRCNSGDFNIHGIESMYGTPEGEIMLQQVEYEPYNGDVIKYYKVKPILPHYLHQIGTEWKPDTLTQRDVTGDNCITNQRFNMANGSTITLTTDDDIIDYTFIPTGKFIDFYNGNKIYESYEPWFEINGQQIRVDDTMIFEASNLKDLGTINSLSSGNGVIVEIGYQTCTLEHLIEEQLDATKNYQSKLEDLNERLDILLDPENSAYINLDETPSKNQLTVYNNYMNNVYQQQVSNSYRSLLNQMSVMG